ncbi:MAG TPA: TonB family protein [Tepidisphaeraceae bacterium]|nr:TonB family protein [Tepidisphaeraceae bacterium]
MTSDSTTNLFPVATLVIWTTWLAVGIIGLRVAYPRPIASAPTPPVVARLVDVKITESSQPQAKAEQRIPTPPIQKTPAPPPPPAMLATPAAPTMVPILTPAPMTAVVIKTPSFVKPSPNAPIATATPRQSPPNASTDPPQAATPPVQSITFGEGEGAQPAPDYPIEAQLDDEQGTVVVRFAVATDGHVTSAAAISPCPWPLLNQAALRAVHDTWQFPPGPPRLYEVVIQFKGQDQ